QAEDGIRDFHVTGVQTCALPIFGNLAGLAGGAQGQGVGAAGLLGALGGLGGAAPRVNTGNRIKITPHVNESSQVRLELELESSEIGRASCRERGGITGVTRAVSK